MSLSSVYPQSGQIKVRSDRVIESWMFPHSGHSFVDGKNLFTTIVFPFITSLCLIVPRAECCTWRPKSPLCHPLMFSSWMTTISWFFFISEITFTALSFLLASRRSYSLLIFHTVLYQPLECFTWRESFLCNPFKRSLSLTRISYAFPSESVMLVFIPKSSPTGVLSLLCFNHRNAWF